MELNKKSIIENKQDSSMHLNGNLEFTPKLKVCDFNYSDVDKLEWAGGITFVTYGLTIAIRTNQLSVLYLIKSRLPPEIVLTQDSEVDCLYSLVVDVEKDPSTVFDFIEKPKELILMSEPKINNSYQLPQELSNELNSENHYGYTTLTSEKQIGATTSFFIEGHQMEDMNCKIKGLGDSHQLYLNSTLIMKSKNLEHLINILESNLLVYIATWAQGFLFIHAGSVSWNDHGIIIPGPSYSGKTSLVAALTRAGAKYYSDEYAVLDEQGQLHPYPKLLSIRRGGESSKIRCSAAYLNGVSGETPVPVSHIISSKYQKGLALDFELCSKGEAVSFLIKNCVSVRRQPEFALKILIKVASNAHCFKGNRGEADEICVTLLNKIVQNEM